MAVLSPRGNAEITRLEERFKRVVQAVSVSSDLAIGNVKLNYFRHRPPQAAKRNVRFKESHAG